MEYLTARNAWCAIGAFVLAYEIVCPDNELLSQGVDRALERHKYLTLGAIALTAGHLANVLPVRYDPFNYITKLR